MQTLDEVARAMTDIDELFREHVFPWLDACDDLAATERLLNRDPDKVFTSNRIGHAINGVIAAALCRRPDFAEIVAYYRDLFKGAVEPIRKKFEAAVAHAATLLPD